MTTKEVVDYFGSKVNVAKALGLDRSAVTLWGESVPKGRQFQIQVLTKGKLKAETKAA